MNRRIFFGLLSALTVALLLSVVIPGVDPNITILLFSFNLVFTIYYIPGFLLKILPRADGRTLRVLYLFVPYFFLLLAFPERIAWSFPQLWVFLVAGAVGAGLWLLHVQSLPMLFKKEYIGFFPVTTSFNYLLDIYLFLVSPFLEEFVYRYLVWKMLLDMLPLFPIAVISTTLFLLHHLLSDPKRVKYAAVDYLAFFLLSATSFTLMVLSGSILPAIVLHATYNLPRLVFSVNMFLHTLQVTRSRSDK